MFDVCLRLGDHAVLDAISSREIHLCPSTIWTDEGVDIGPLLMVYRPLEVSLPEPFEPLLENWERLLRVIECCQKALREAGDWKILPRTVEMIARGRFTLDKEGRVYGDRRLCPKGYREQAWSGRC